MQPAHEIEVFFDGECPLCVREASFLRRRDREGRILFSDIAAPDFDPAATGITWERLMDRIHGRLRDGTVVEGVEVFRRLYTAIGWGWLVPVTRVAGISQLLDLGYRLFAKNRLKLTGRCDHDDNGVCRVPRRAAP
jgi:predicted DCC family thiol-disulfide oxidoreductase YuxK